MNNYNNDYSNYDIYDLGWQFLGCIIAIIMVAAVFWYYGGWR